MSRNPELSVFAKAMLEQLFFDGPTWDGNCTSKTGRDELVDLGLAVHWNGYCSLTAEGLMQAVGVHKLDRKKEIRHRERYTYFRLVSDNSGHDYVIPVDRSEDWEAFMAIPEDDQASWEVPDFAHQVEGDLQFSWPIINDEAVIRKMRP